MVFNLISCFNRKITKQWRARSITMDLFWSVLFHSCCSRQGPPYEIEALKVIGLQKVVPSLPLSYLGKVKNLLFPLIFFQESQKVWEVAWFPPPWAPYGIHNSQGLKTRRSSTFHKNTVWKFTSITNGRTNQLLDQKYDGPDSVGSYLPHILRKLQISSVFQKVAVWLLNSMFFGPNSTKITFNYFY